VDRNHVKRGHPAVSKLSPAIRFRLVTEEEIIKETLQGRPIHQVDKWLQEVSWRIYWKGWLEAHPGVWTDYRLHLGQIRESISPEQLARAEAVIMGRSGVAIMDHFARELLRTGYLHNHARMWWASFWIHVEKLPWELGADHFFRHLLDADAASNTLSWRWVAGLQTKGKSYLVRRSNLEKYVSPSLMRDSRGLERLDDNVVKIITLNEDSNLARQELGSYPALPENLPERYGIWIHSDDLSPERSAMGTLKPSAVAAFMSSSLARRFGVSSLREEHGRFALQDAVNRSMSHFGCSGTCLDVVDHATAIIAWAQREKLTSLVAFRPFVGPLNDAAPSLEAAFKRAGLALHWVRRKTDSEWLPLATTGFFPFWENFRMSLLDLV
jgi:deoxyribodipyrimidine photo-lyase